MSGALRILHLADSHIGAGLPPRPRRPRRTRGDDLIDSYRRALGRAREHDVDLVLHAGDVFDTPDPTPVAIAAAAEPLLALAADGIPVVIVPGNHERSLLPASLLLAHPNIHVIDGPRTLLFDLRGTRVAVTGLPCIRRGVADSFEGALAAAGWEQATEAELRLLVLHQAIESATCGPGHFRFRSGEDVIDRAQLPAAFDYVALGHVHRHQQLAGCLGNAPIVYAGSPDRVSFAERDEPKGCVLVRGGTDGLTPTFLEHAVRPMTITPLDVTDLSRRQLEDALESAVRDLPPAAIAQLRLTGMADPGVLRGLRLSQRARAWRSDVDLRVQMQQVELRPARQAMNAGNGDARTADAFAGFPLTAPFPPRPAAPGGRDAALERVRPDVLLGPVSALAALPDVCGVYALRDGRGRLLYVGKAIRLRTRLRAHLRHTGGAEYYAGWSRQIHAFEARAAAGELEALLVEAELIRRLRPPFNRQMKSWQRYCYLTWGRLPHDQLEITAEPDPEHHSIGPYRSRFTAEEVIATVSAVFRTAMCPGGAGAGREGAGRMVGGGALPLLADAAALRCQRYYADLCLGPCAAAAPADHRRQVAARTALLTGRDDSVVSAFEEELERQQAAGVDHDTLRPLRHTAHALRAAFDTGAALRAARELLERAAGRSNGGERAPACVPKAVSDLLLTAERGARHAADGLKPPWLLALVDRLCGTNGRSRNGSAT